MPADYLPVALGVALGLDVAEAAGAALEAGVVEAGAVDAGAAAAALVAAPGNVASLFGSLFKSSRSNMLVPVGFGAGFRSR